MTSADVIRHYHQDDLYQKILEGLRQLDIDLENITAADLWPVDQFHVGGAQSTLKLLSKFPLTSTSKVLDVGCGIGGPCRMFAQEYQCQVQGIDLTPVFVETASKLSKLVGLEHLTTFSVADALELPFEDERFDVVWTQHVQMNIAHKKRFYGEMARVLKIEGRLMFHDLFKSTDGSIRYPVPWSEDAANSFLFAFKELEELLIGIGFQRTYCNMDNAFAVQFFEQVQSAVKET
ncbi:MAG: methyltransferase domain-containing protein, partial [Cyclobacteriaceae bacterium]|nr:methyltransferase domain-containing protein [Cyclobacteriaceae bacterium]